MQTIHNSAAIGVVRRILDTYKFRGRLNRLEFLVAILTLGAIATLAAFAVRQFYLENASFGLQYLVAKIGVGGAFAILTMPLCIARLRDIGWSSWSVVLILVPVFLDIKLVIVLKELYGWDVPIFSPIFLLLIMVYIVWAGLLLMKRGNNAVGV